MTERKWAYPIDSRFIFKLLQKVSNQQNNSKLNEWLLLDSNEGQSFSGTSKRVKYCWWPDHESFFYYAFRLQEDEEKGLEFDLWDIENQKFPLPENPLQWSTIAKNINKRIQNPRAKYINPNFSKERVEEDEVRGQLTFESHVYNVLNECFNRFSSEKEKKDFILNFCKEAWIPQFEINKIQETETIEDILSHIIIRAKENVGLPLTVPFVDKVADEDKPETDWQICSANELKMNPIEISARIMENDKALYNELPDSCAGSQRQWADVFISFPKFCKFLLDPQGDIQGNFSAVGLTREQEGKMQQGRFVDSELDVCFCDPLHTPGEHVLYLLNLSINHDVEIGKYYALWDDLIALIKQSAREGIFFTKIYYKAFLPEHRAMVIGRGFRFLCYDAEYGAVFVHEMNPTSTLRVLDEELAALYRDRKNQKQSTFAVSNDELEAADGFQNMFRLIDELFRHPRLAELKPYFFSNIGLPENDNLRQLGIATAETLRDILQYSKSLLDYLDENYSRTYEDYSSMIMESALVKVGMEQYQFVTEHPDFNIKRLGIDQVNAKDIVNFAMIWIDLDKLFMMRDDTLRLRPYFYERSDSLPKEEEMLIATALVVRLLSAMKIAESLLDRIPNHFVISYYKYKEMVKSIQIVQKVVTQAPFLKDELMWQRL